MTKTGLIESHVLVTTGTLICDIVQDEPREPEAAFLLKEKRLFLDLILLDKVEIEFRCSHIPLDDVLLIPLLMRFNGNPELTYETWFNFYQSRDVQKCFAYLATQEIIRILFRDEYDQSVEVVHVPNNIRLGFLDTLQRFKNLVPWSGDKYECAKLKFLQLYPDTNSLWRGLKERLRPGLKKN